LINSSRKELCYISGSRGFVHVSCKKKGIERGRDTSEAAAAAVSSTQEEEKAKKDPRVLIV
jgi:hypothetical protein